VQVQRYRRYRRYCLLSCDTVPSVPEVEDTVLMPYCRCDATGFELNMDIVGAPYGAQGKLAEEDQMGVGALLVGTRQKVRGC
jgi:hypothetical protein